MVKDTIGYIATGVEVFSIGSRTLPGVFDVHLRLVTDARSQSCAIILLRS